VGSHVYDRPGRCRRDSGVARQRPARIRRGSPGDASVVCPCRRTTLSISQITRSEAHHAGSSHVPFRTTPATYDHCRHPRGRWEIFSFHFSSAGAPPSCCSRRSSAYVRTYAAEAPSRHRHALCHIALSHTTRHRHWRFTLPLRTLGAIAGPGGDRSSPRRDTAAYAPG